MTTDSNGHGHAGGTDHLAEVLAEVGEILDNRGIPAAERTLILEGIRAADEKAARRNLVDFWRRVAARHGVRATAKAFGLKRWAFLEFLAGLSKLPTVYHMAAANRDRAQWLDEDAAEKLTGSHAP